MDKIIVIIAIGIAIILGGIFAVRFFYNPAGELESAPVATPRIPPPPLAPQITTPPAQVAPAPTSTPKPAIVKLPATSSNVLDRIEAAIRAKLKR